MAPTITFRRKLARPYPTIDPLSHTPSQSCPTGILGRQPSITRSRCLVQKHIIIIHHSRWRRWMRAEGGFNLSDPASSSRHGVRPHPASDADSRGGSAQRPHVHLPSQGPRD
ncbi:hypothetical protein M413DRAFT_348890 [Hebeloma cylindrosporum]|uniref:Uncharacterized protein n=1 Tax=Hebeloma cylindrosporum TaxID=76867 RepID=A0A0C3BFB6_HEBCY|nr:hypothetical protein M413DRAFT_348890 [Hebeloma cylindrosporum h7]